MEYNYYCFALELLLDIVKVEYVHHCHHVHV